jgi:excisionase family DNA binding protein
METTESAYISIRELAAYLGISRRTAYSLVVGGSVPSVRIGGPHRIPRAELERQLAERLRQAP